jgi:alpha-1,3-rhamnosyl/mannosyltransferase
MTLDVYYNAAPLLGPKTGVGQYCLHLMSAMQAQADIHSHYFYSWNWSGELRGQSRKRMGADKGMLRRVAETFPNLSYRLWYEARSVLFSSGARRSGRSVYHEPSFIAFRSRLPTVVTVHDLSILRYPETHPSYRVAVLKNRIGESARRADCVITDSEYVRREVMESFGLPEDRVVAVLLAAAESFSPVADDDLCAGLSEYDLQSGKYVLAVGTLEPRKNLVTAIQAYARLPEPVRQEFPLVIVGMKGWRMEDFDRQVGAMIEAGQIRRLGYVPDEKLPVLYSGARVFVYPSLYEGFGLPPLEAMACGSPVIVSNRSSLPEVVGDAGLQVEALDVDALADAMRRVIENDDLRAMLGRKGIERAASFSWQKCAQETAVIYRKVAG